MSKYHFTINGDNTEGWRLGVYEYVSCLHSPQNTTITATTTKDFTFKTLDELLEHLQPLINLTKEMNEVT